MKPSHFIRTCGVIAAIAFMGCGDDPPPASTAAPKAAPAAAAKKKEAEVAPAFEQTQASLDYLYNPVGKRDPFRGLNIENASSGELLDEVPMCTDPLCQIDTDDLTVVAVVSGDANPMAMVEDRLGVGHMVRRNSKIGKHGGKVTQILRDCIVVTSYIKGPDSRDVATKNSMCVKTDVRSSPVLNLLDGKLRQ